MWLEDMEQFTYCKCKVGSLSRFAHFGMRICGGAELSSCSYLVDHISISLVFKVDLIGWRSSLEDKTWPFLVHPFLQLVSSKNLKGYSCSFSPSK